MIKNESTSIRRNEVRVYVDQEVPIAALIVRLIDFGFEEEKHHLSRLYTIYPSLIVDKNMVDGRSDRIRIYLPLGFNLSQSITTGCFKAFREVKNQTEKVRFPLEPAAFITTIQKLSRIPFTCSNRRYFSSRDGVTRMTIDSDYTTGFLARCDETLEEDIVYRVSNLRVELKTISIEPEKDLFQILSGFSKRLVSSDEEFLASFHLAQQKSDYPIVLHSFGGFSKEGLTLNDEVQLKFNVVGRNKSKPWFLAQEIFCLFERNNFFPYCLSRCHGKRQSEVGQINRQFYVVDYFGSLFTDDSCALITDPKKPHLVALSIKLSSPLQRFFPRAICRRDVGGTIIVDKASGLSMLSEMVSGGQLTYFGRTSRQRFYFFVSNSLTFRNFWVSCDRSINKKTGQALSQFELEYKGRSGLCGVNSIGLSSYKIEDDLSGLSARILQSFCGELKPTVLTKIQWLKQVLDPFSD